MRRENFLYPQAFIPTFQECTVRQRKPEYMAISSIHKRLRSGKTSEWPLTGSNRKDTSKLLPLATSLSHLVVM
jgi:hypothetical protein